MKDVCDTEGGFAMTQGQNRFETAATVAPVLSVSTGSVVSMAGAASPFEPLQARSGKKQRPARYGVYGKRCLDLLIVVLSLPFTLVVVGLCAMALWLEGGAPFYRQERLGQGGKVFSILKLRTMVRDADTMLAYFLDNDPAMRAEWEQTQKLKKDPRVTKVGRVLRVTSLDELPQLWNVLKGEMSLVGPRPMMPEQLPLYGDPSAYFALRPGITGLWQVSARNESSFAARNELDRRYLEIQSLRTDATLIQRTFGVVFKGTGY